MTTKHWTLRPLNHKPTNFDPYYEQILVLEDNYPIALMHIDTWYEWKEGDSIYSNLVSGESVNVEVTFRIVED